MNIVILSRNKNLYSTRRLVEEAEDRGHDVQVIDPLNCDLIIETHDFLNIEISGNLKKLFSKTHDVESIFSIDDIHKAQNYHYTELSDKTLENRKRILSEKRPSIMEWVICRSKR